MPDFWTHIIGGEEILKKLDDDIKEIVQENQKLFNFGCQGPDFLFYNDFWPWIKTKRGPSVGTDIHSLYSKKLIINSNNHLKSKANSKDFNKLLSYYYGFLCHYVIDKWCHPFIISRADNSDSHKILESKLDVFFADKYWNSNAYKLSPSCAIDLGEKLPTVVVEYYKNIISSIYRPSSSIDYINESYRDMKKVLSIFYSPYPIKRLGLDILNTMLPMDISIYIYPKNLDAKFLTSKELEEFQSLFNQGVNEGIELIQLINHYIIMHNNKNIYDYLKNINFLGETID